MNKVLESFYENKNKNLYNSILENVSNLINEATDVSNSPHLETIESAIAQIQQQNQIDINLLKIRKAINAEFKTNCVKVFITNNKVKSYFFGAHIIPTEEECYKIVDGLCKLDTNVKFEKCSEFVIELDSKLVFELGATPEEVTAVLLHEIGHKVFYSRNKVRMKAKLMEVALSNVTVGGIAAITSKLLSLKFLLLTLVLNYFNSSFCYAIDMKEEIDADSFAIKYGYAVHLHSVMNKIVDKGRLFGSFGFGRNKEKEDKAIATWCIKNVLDFKLRKESIKKDLRMMIKTETNPEVKKILQHQLSMCENMEKRTKGLRTVNMSMFSNGTQITSESFSSFVEMNSKGMSYLELDELEVEIDRIKDHEDKLYVLSRIHKNLADSGKLIKEKQTQLEKKKMTSQQIKDNVEMQELLAFRRRLMDLLAMCKKVKPKERYQHFIVGYPLGYEG